MNIRIIILITGILVLGNLMQILNTPYSDPYSYSSAKLVKDFINHDSTDSVFSFYYDYIRSYSIFSLGTMSKVITQGLIKYNGFPERNIILTIFWRTSFLLIILAVTSGLFREFKIKENKNYIYLPILLIAVYPLWLVNVVRISMILGILSIYLLIKYLNSGNIKYIIISIVFLIFGFFEHITSFGAYFSLYLTIFTIYHIKNYKKSLNSAKSILKLIIGLMIASIPMMIVIQKSPIFNLAPALFNKLFSFHTSIISFLAEFANTSPAGQLYLSLNIIQFLILFIPIILALSNKKLKTSYFTLSLLIWPIILSSILLYFMVPARLFQYLAPFSMILLAMTGYRYKKYTILPLFLIAFVTTVLLYGFPQQNIHITQNGVTCGDWIVSNFEKDTGIFADLRVGGFLVYNDFTRIDGPYSTLSHDLHEENFTILSKYMDHRDISLLVLDDKDIKYGVYPYNTPYVLEKVSQEYINSIDASKSTDRIYSSGCIIYKK